jgi:hypothetical protein
MDNYCIMGNQVLELTYTYENLIPVRVFTENKFSPEVKALYLS